MAPDDPTPGYGTALVHDGTTALSTAPAALAPSPVAARAALPAVQSTVPQMLHASVEAFGDVVSALLTDLEQVGDGVAAFSWLSSSRGVLENEVHHRVAMQQLQWWDGFLSQLPSPRLLSEEHRVRLQRHKTAEARARLAAHEAAFAEHRQRIEEELTDRTLSPAARVRIRRQQRDPEPDEWRVDPDAWVSTALAQLPPPPDIVPIVPEDLHPQTNPGGFHAVETMRRHAELGPRAAALDGAIAAVLQENLDRPEDDAQRHAGALTDIFWLALRRALSQGSHQLASSLQLMSNPEALRIQTDFATELLESWAAYLANMPPVPERRSLASRIPLLGRLFKRKPKALSGTTPRALPPPEAE
jgi:hypothetical protein